MSAAIPDGQEVAELALLQSTLADRLLPYDAVRQALLVIARLGDVFDEDDPERAQDAIGLLLAHAAVLALIEGMAIGPILDLATALRQRGDVQPIRAPGMLATAVMLDRGPFSGPRPDRDTCRLEIVEALAFAIAKAVDDAEIGHEIEIKDPRRLLVQVTGEVVAGKLPRSPRKAERLMETASRDNRPRPVDPERKAAALKQLQAAAEALAADPGPDTADGEAFMATMATDGVAAAIQKHKAPVAPGDVMGLAEFVINRIEVQSDDPDRLAFGLPGHPLRMQIEDPGGPGQIGPHGEVLAPPGWRQETDAELRARIKAPDPRKEHADRTDEEQRLGVSAATVCPHDASAMSEGLDSLLRCSGSPRHVFWRNQAGELIEGDRPSPVTRSGRHFPPPPRKP